MSYNGSGVYSLPAGYLVANGDTVLPSQHNTPLEDLEAAQNASRPIVAGGTGANTAATARDNLGVSDKVLSKSGAYTVAAGDRGKIIRCTAALTLTLLAASTAGDGFSIWVMADGGDVTIDPTGAETIDGSATVTVPDGVEVQVFCDGTAWYAKVGLGSNPTLSGLSISAATPTIDFLDSGGDTVGVFQVNSTDVFSMGDLYSYTPSGIDFGVGGIPTAPLHVSYDDASASTTTIIENENAGGSAQVRVSLQRGGDSGTGLVKGGIFFVTNNSFGMADYEARDINFLTGTSAGAASARVTIPAEGGLKTTATTVSGLPSASTVGAGTRHFVTDANATTFASVVAGGGSNGVPVYSDGTNWRIG